MLKNLQVAPFNLM